MTFSPAIVELRSGEVLIAWGGRRVATAIYGPPAIGGTGLAGGPMFTFWLFRWEAEPIIVTRIYDRYRKRQDFIAADFGQNPALSQDGTGRVWLGYRMPTLCEDEPEDADRVDALMRSGVSSNTMVKNLRTTAGLNWWALSERGSAEDFSALAELRAPVRQAGRNTAWHAGFELPLFWSEQIDLRDTDIPLSPPDGEILASADYDTLDGYLSAIGQGWRQNDEQEGVHSPYTRFCALSRHRLTGEVILRGMGGNRLGNVNPLAWDYLGEMEGLDGPTLPYSDIGFATTGQQVRIQPDITGQPFALWARGSTWPGLDRRVAVRGLHSHFDWLGRHWTVGHVPKEPGVVRAIPWRVADPLEYVTEAIDTYDSAEQARQLEWEARWAADNGEDEITDFGPVHQSRNMPAAEAISRYNAVVSQDRYVSGQVILNGRVVNLRDAQDPGPGLREIYREYYAWPDLSGQRPAHTTTRTGQQLLAWQHGNLAFVEGDDGHNAVGLRVAISSDDGKTFEPLIPERTNALSGEGA